MVRAGRPFNPISLLVRECMSCGKLLGFKDGRGVSGTTHGICDECGRQLLAEEGLCTAVAIAG
ncbi:MAG: hypothetical protein J7K75_08590 [Desulfuromonas sp.]|nr:hypothetical protein [Desulfuromonas sp.]